MPEPFAGGFSGLSASLRAAGTRLAATLMLLVVASLLAAGGTALLFAALYLWLATLLAPPAAALLTGLAVFVAAGLLLLIGRRAGRPRRPHVAGQTGAAAAGLPPGAGPSGVTAAVASEFGLASAAWMRDHAPQAVLGVAAAGFLIGVSPRLRRVLWRLLR